MNRRNFIAGLGALGVTSAGALGTGAFSTAQTQRDVAIETAGDTDGLLAFEATSEFVRFEDGLFELDLTSSNPTPEGGEGVSPDSVYVIDGAYEIENQGTQEVQITYEDGEVPGTPTLELTNVPIGDLTFVAGPEDPGDAVIGPGESVSYFLMITMAAKETETLEETVEIKADLNNPSPEPVPDPEEIVDALDIEDPVLEQRTLTHLQERLE